MKNPRGCVIYRPVKCVAIQTGSAIRLSCICLVPRSHLLKRGNKITWASAPGHNTEPFGPP